MTQPVVLLYLRMTRDEAYAALNAADAAVAAGQAAIQSAASAYYAQLGVINAETIKGNTLGQVYRDVSSAQSDLLVAQTRARAQFDSIANASPGPAMA